jgi:hypothetical protein
LFAYAAMKYIKPHINEAKYRSVLGPLWIKGQEWVEWDGAIVKKEAKEILPQYFDGEDVLVLFEFKVAGIYGTKQKVEGKKTVAEAVTGIKKNFEEAKTKCCPNLVGSFYITLFEREPKPSEKQPFDYWKATKALLPDVTPCALFNSIGFGKTNKEEILVPWSEVIDSLKQELL